MMDKIQTLVIMNFSLSVLPTRLTITQQNQSHQKSTSFLYNAYHPNSSKLLRSIFHSSKQVKHEKKRDCFEDKIVILVVSMKLKYE